MANRIKGRSPHGERGLKYQVDQGPAGVNQSLPSRGAWIEIRPMTQQEIADQGRSPHGERGLKLGPFVDELYSGRSLPSRGAWIEIWATPEILP